MDRYATLRNGLAGAWCPSLRYGGYVLEDRSGFRNNGALSSGTRWIAARGGVALEFPASQFVDCGSLASDAFGYPFAASCWVRNVTNNDTSPLSKAQQDDSYAGWMIYIVAGKAVAYWRSGIRATSNKTVTGVSAWQHLLIQWTGTQAQVWIDGVLDVQSATTTAPSAGATNVNIGRYQVGTTGGRENRSISGQVDDCRIYRRPLTPAEIRLLASARGIGLLPTRHRRGWLLAQFWLKVAGTWKAAKPWINVGGTWRQGSPKLRTGGAWKG